MRLFTAIDIPRRLHSDIAALRDDSLKGARWTNRHQWHITLHFIGEVEALEPIEAALQAITAEDFPLSLRGIGTFPAKGKPRVLWVGVDAPPTLQTLHRRVGEALATTGFQPDKRPYNPHLTLARFKQVAPGIQSMRAYREQHATFATEPFAAAVITLYESRLMPSGAHYSVRSRIPLHTA